MALREPSLSFGPWAKANNHLISYIHSIYHFREFYTKNGVFTFFEGVNIRGKYSFVIYDCSLFQE